MKKRRIKIKNVLNLLSAAFVMLWLSSGYLHKGIHSHSLTTYSRVKSHLDIQKSNGVLLVAQRRPIPLS
jgi:hypothetical protein